ncbi:MAG: FG-GAP-like repeat-containing protein [Acidobacteriota bacterium]
MKKTLLPALAVMALAFVLITLFKWRPPDLDRPRLSEAEKLERTRIQQFWRFYHEATELRTQGDFFGAAKRYEQALLINPTHEDSLYSLGNCLFERGDYAGARRLYARLTELNPNSQRAFAQLGRTLSAPLPGAPLDLNRARQAFLRNTRINPEESGPFLRLGLLELQADQLGPAFRYFQTAAGFRSPEGYFLSGFVRYRQGRFKEAIPLFEKVLRIQLKEAAIAGKGIPSEGDVRGGQGPQKLTPLQSAAIRSKVYLYWAARRLGGYPSSVPAEFRLRDPGSRVDRESLSLPLSLHPEGSGGTVSWVDNDGDGDLDLSLCTGGRLYLLQNDRGRLAPLPLASWGLNLRGKAWDAVWGDFDSDGDLDLFVIGSGFIGEERNFLYRNDPAVPPGVRAFVDVTAGAGLEGRRSTMGAFFWDYDRDGRMDLLEVGAGSPGIRLFRNLGGGRFTESAQRAGLAPGGSVVDAARGDYDGDGFDDLFVLRWKQPGLLFRNRHDGTFVDTTRQAGLGQVGGDGYSALFFDYDRDNRPDLLVTHHAAYDRALQCLIHPERKVTSQTPRLFRNTAQHRFEEVTRRMGLDGCYGTMQAVAVDVDGDQWTDLILANGGLRPDRLEPAVVLRNRSGQAFTEYLRLPAFDTPANGRGVAAADFDQDGAVEVILVGGGFFRLKAIHPQEFSPQRPEKSSVRSPPEG